MTFYSSFARPYTIMKCVMESEINNNYQNTGKESAYLIKQVLDATVKIITLTRTKYPMLASAPAVILVYVKAALGH